MADTDLDAAKAEALSDDNDTEVVEEESVEEEEAIGATRDNLNQLGQQGWDLVSVLTRSDPGSGICDYYMILKRPLRKSSLVTS